MNTGHGNKWWFFVIRSQKNSLNLAKRMYKNANFCLRITRKKIANFHQIIAEKNEKFFQKVYNLMKWSRRNQEFRQSIMEKNREFRQKMPKWIPNSINRSSKNIYREFRQVIAEKIHLCQSVAENSGNLAKDRGKKIANFTNSLEGGGFPQRTEEKYLNFINNLRSLKQMAIFVILSRKNYQKLSSKEGRKKLLFSL